MRSNLLIFLLMTVISQSKGQHISNELDSMILVIENQYSQPDNVGSGDDEQSMLLDCGRKSMILDEDLLVEILHCSNACRAKCDSLFMENKFEIQKLANQEFASSVVVLNDEEERFSVEIISDLGQNKVFMGGSVLRHKRFLFNVKLITVEKGNFNRLRKKYSFLFE